MVIVNHIVLIETEMGVEFLFIFDIPSQPLADHKLPHDIEGTFVAKPGQSDEYFFHQV